MSTKGKPYSSKNMPASTTVLAILSIITSTMALLLILLFLPSYQRNVELSGEYQSAQVVKNAHLANASTPVIDPSQQRVYFYEANLYVPLTAQAGNLLYSYTALEENTSQEPTAIMRIDSKPAVYGESPTSDELVCANLARINFGQKWQDRPSDQDFPLEATVELQDGRMLYVYANRSENCSSEAFFRKGLGPDVVVKLFRQAKSY